MTDQIFKFKVDKHRRTHFLWYLVRSDQATAYFRNTKIMFWRPNSLYFQISQSNKGGCQCYKNYLQRQKKYLSEKNLRGAYPLLQTMHHHRPNETVGLRKRYTHNNSETKYTSFYSSFPFATSHTLKTWTRERKQSPVTERTLWDTDSLATTHSPPRSPPLSLRKRRSLSARRIQGHAVK